MIKTNSLAFRLFISAMLLALVILPVTAFLLVAKFRASVERSFDTTLHQFLILMVDNSVVQGESGRLTQPPRMPHPIFKPPYSGWYWQITALDGGEPKRFVSPSLLDEEIPLPSQTGVTAGADRLYRASLPGPDGQKLRVVERIITLGPNADAPRYSYLVAADEATYQKEVSAFLTTLTLAFLALGLGMMVATFLQVRYGLRPLREMRKGLAAIRSGKARILEGDYPEEIKPLQKELNALILANHEIVARARGHVENLAHALKIPLSVVTNAADRNEPGLAKIAATQMAIMRDHITHHLKRAGMAAGAGVIGSVCQLDEVVTPLLRVLGRIYEGRNLSLAAHIPPDAKFSGEKQDLEEILGNLLDNACKWAKSQVRLEAEILTAGSEKKSREDNEKTLRIVIDDDGKGLSEAEREQALKRGGRLDESMPGSGLGLAIVVDHVSLYKGTVELAASPLGGLRVILTLPAA